LGRHIIWRNINRHKSSNHLILIRKYAIRADRRPDREKEQSLPLIDHDGAEMSEHPDSPETNYGQIAGKLSPATFVSNDLRKVLPVQKAN
jgi:hypothetical protein